MFVVKNIDGTGNGKKVVATAVINKGTILCRFTGPIIKYSDTKELGAKESYALQISKDSYRLLNEPYRYFNHCCEPNCGLTPHLELIALKSIKENEELRYDYSTTMMERDWKMKCTCNTPSCRKIITDFDKLPKELQAHYIKLNTVQQYIIEALKNKK